MNKIEEFVLGYCYSDVDGRGGWGDNGFGNGDGYGDGYG